MEKIKTGIIGFGRMAGRCHFPRMKESGLYEMVAVCDITEARRQAAEEEGMQATGDLEQFLDMDLELVVITTHSAQHHDDALKVAAAGKHILIEKPMTQTGPQAEALVAAAKANNVTLSVYHNRHFDNDYRMVKAAVQEGLLGDLVTLENRTAGARPAVGFGVPEYDQKWRITAAAGGGTLLDFGPHWVEQIVDLLDGVKIVQVFGDVRHIKWGDADDLFRIDMIFENGVRAMAGKMDISYCGWPHKWYVAGSEATLHGPDGDRVVINGADYELRRETAVEAYDLHVNLAEHLREGKPLIITPDHALRVMQVIQAGVDSSQAGKSLDVCI